MGYPDSRPRDGLVVVGEGGRSTPSVLLGRQPATFYLLFMLTHALYIDGVIVSQARVSGKHGHQHGRRTVQRVASRSETPLSL